MRVNAGPSMAAMSTPSNRRPNGLLDLLAMFPRCLRSAHETRRAAAPPRNHFEACADSLLQLGHVRDYAYQTAAGLQILERPHRQVERLGIERTEALVD